MVSKVVRSSSVVEGTQVSRITEVANINADGPLAGDAITVLICPGRNEGFVSRPSEKFRFEPSRKFLLTAVRLKDGTNRDEPRRTRSPGLVEASEVRKHDATGSSSEDRNQ